MAAILLDQGLKVGLDFGEGDRVRVSAGRHSCVSDRRDACIGNSKAKAQGTTVMRSGGRDERRRGGIGRACGFNGAVHRKAPREETAPPTTDLKSARTVPFATEAVAARMSASG